MERIWGYTIKNEPDTVNIIMSDAARQLRNDISILIEGYHFKLDRKAKNDLIALAKDITYFLGDKYNC